MKRNLLAATGLIGAVLLFSTNSTAQNVAINATGAAPNASAMLDINSATMGILIPRMTTAQRTAIVTPANGLQVYDTTTGSFWYYNGAVWVQIATGAAGWTILGNAGTVAATNFLGTTDAVDLVFRVNNTERMRIVSSNGFLGINTTAPTARLQAVAAAVSGNTAISGTIAAQGSGHLAYFNNIALGAFGTLPSALVFADESAAGNSPTLVSRSLNPASYSAAISYSDVWIAGYYGVDNATTGNPPALYGQLNISNTALGGFQSAARGYNNRTAASGNPGYTIGLLGTAVGSTQDGMGVMGEYYGTGGGVRTGGYFTAGANYTYVADNVNNRKVIGAGTVSEIIPTQNNGRVTLTCPESPEYWYIDYGTIQMVNGKAHVDLDPILMEVIIVDAENPLKVITQVNILECNGVAVVNKTATGFDIVELRGGTSTGEIDYQIVARPKTNYGEGRFPQAPSPAGMKDAPITKAKAANPGNRTTMYRWPADWEVYGYDPATYTKIGDVVPGGPHAGKIKIAEGVYSDHLPLEAPKR
ncbi:MAG: hypothetical protein M3R17_17760 [Bacteroidota bacterium]|nr:hypothetical protein [Bacteroidota bacterium]